MIWQVILFVTSKCNLRCASCFYRENLNLQNDLSMDDLHTLINGLPRLNNIIVTGGEPFLRPELPDILRIIHEHQPDLEIHLNTNGTFPDRVERVVVEYLSRGGRLGLNVSLDGDKEVHASMRGADIHHKVMETLERGTALKRKFPNMYFTVNSLLCPETIEGMPELLDLKSRGVALDFHNVEIRRLDEQFNESIPPDRLRDFYRFYLDRITRDYPDYYEINRARFELQYGNAMFGTGWGYPCNAGQKAVVVYHDGALAPCEMLPSVLNLRDFGFDLGKALESEAMREATRRIRQTGCSCTHGCWLVTSMFEHLTRTCGELDFTRVPVKDRDRRLIPRETAVAEAAS